MVEGFKQRLKLDMRHAEHGDISSLFGQNVRAPRTMVDEETWAQIAELQRARKDLLRDYKEWRTRLWSGESGASPENSEHTTRTLGMRPDGTLVTYLKGGAEVSMALGEAFAASEWGFWWKFDTSVPQDMQRRIMTHQVRRALAGMYDQQLLRFGAADRLSDDYKRDAYARKTATEQSLEALPDGILAEKMLFSLLTKEMHESGRAFTVEAPDVYEDIEHKIDLVVTVSDTRRGVTVGEPRHRIGIQFTRSASLREKKQQQVDRANRHIADTDVDEIILVVMPLSDTRDIFDAWRYGPDKNRTPLNKLDPRGPDHLWSAETKQQIIDALVHGRGVEEAE